jgi:hypothetical protein
MELTVVRIGDITRNGNNIIKLQNKADEVTPLGKVSRSSTYYIAVKDGTATVEVDQSIDLDIDSFNVTERAYTEEDGSLPQDGDGNDICDDDGNPLMLKWLSLK